MKSCLAALTALALLPASALAQDDRVQESGVLGSPPPQDIFLEVTTGDDGEPILSGDEFTLATGGYYRFNFVCPDAQSDSTGFHFEATELVENSHLRVISIGEADLEVYMQGLSFHAFQCDDVGSLRFSFHPMRSGVYDLYVRDQSDPPQEALGRIIVE